MDYFYKIDVSTEVENLYAEYKKLDLHLNFPRSGNLKAFKAYEFYLGNKLGVKVTKYIRNSTALEKFQAMIVRLDTFFVGIEYFKQNIIFEQSQGLKIPIKFKDEFFISIISDSLRTSLDIYSKFVAWFYDLPERDEIGFNYKKMIKPLENYSKKISREANKIYKSSEYKFIKEIRDSDKHIGKNQNQIKLESSLQRLNFEFKRAQKISFAEFELNSSLLFMSIKKLLLVTVDEFCKTKLGYDSKNDVELIEGKNGNLEKL